MTIGKRIASLRRRQSLTQPMLADKMHVSQSTITSWENDRRAVGNEDLVKLADLFGVTTDYLLGRKTDLGDVPVAAHFTEDYDNFTAAERQEIVEYIEFKKAQYKKRHENENKD